MSDGTASTTATDSDPDEAAAPRASWKRWAVIAVALAAIVIVAPNAGEALPRLFRWVDGLGPWGPIAFVAIYVASTVLVVPGALITLAGGALFGLAEGTVWVFIGAVLGSGAAFLVGRYVARRAVAERIAQNQRFAAVDRAVERDGLKVVFLLRLSPVFPFSFLNYALGLTAVRFRDYMIASIGMLPGTLLYVYYGKVAGDLAKLATGVPQERGVAEWAMLILGLLATLGVTIVVTRIARRALTEIEDVPEDVVHATESEGTPDEAR